ncbi:hypothetical protein [Thermoproteus uzoniensis]|nr:hypothetical protein [Thermoproteus uzoniensis]
MACPKCGSRDVRISPSGKYVCNSCGYSWQIPMADLEWAQRIFRVEKLYEEFKDVRPIDCARMKGEMVKKGVSEDDAAKIVRRIARRAARLTNDKREKDALAAIIEGC